ncbi:uncharacterized protein BP5553_08590 [Venustampulla echinocandica]|uniref:Uncharacterized protein n=1 Tax=Venustampulla echinocandica TaxID=2656787 RepID=A0A370TEP9_9HELO|nr:uncharacterized protein BP5553_08590 [Venustampulla echinocandica]RDL33151.1 hypothetical protein BP5553_08590 [Venustampulla echinocandica]
MAEQPHNKKKPSMKPTPNVGNTRIRWWRSPSQQPPALKRSAEEDVDDSDEGPFVWTRAERERRKAKEKIRKLNSPEGIPKKGSKSARRGVSPVNLGDILAFLAENEPNPANRPPSSTPFSNNPASNKSSPNVSISQASRMTGRKRLRGEVPGLVEDTRSSKKYKPSKSKEYEIAKPKRLTYDSLSEEDMPDEWFRKRFDRLYKRTLEVVEEHFIVPSFEETELRDVKVGPEFIFWAEKVAEADPNSGGWQKLFQNPTQRKYLIAAILVLIFKIKIFDVYLWGSSDPQHQLLHNIDRSFFTHDGFFRTAMRSDAVRNIVGGGPVTVGFYEEVAKLTAQTFALLKPLTNHLHPPREVDITLIEAQFQAIHDLISDTAYLSIRIRMSPTIFFWVNATPGTRYNQDDHVNVDMGSWRDSKQAVRVDYENRQRTHVAQKNAARKEYQERQSEAARERLVQIEKQEPLDPSFDHVAMVKIGVWPSIRRFKPGTEADDQKALRTKVPLGGMRGSREHEICKASIVCYYGKSTETNSGREGLDAFIKRKWGAKGLLKLNVRHELQEVIATAAAAMVGGALYTLSQRKW